MNPVRPPRLPATARAHRRLPALREAALFRDSALRGNQFQAQSLMGEAMQRGFSLTEASVRMVQPAMVEVGRMWQQDRITVAREHVATAISQNVLARAFLDADVAPPLGRKALLAGAPDNLHDLGLRILADALETHGWTTVELGAAVPAVELLSRVDFEQPEIVCLSVAMPEQADAAREAIVRLRAELGTRCPAIWVGGQATLAGRRDRLVAHADGWAADAMHALQQLQACEVESFSWSVVHWHATGMIEVMSESKHEKPGSGSLFEDLPLVDEAQAQAQAAARARDAARRQGPARVLQPNRGQIELRASDLDSLLGEDHRARLVWGYVERQDLSRLTDAIKARGSNAGRSAIDPRIVFALWLYATLDGVGSGRELARLAREHDAYRWICGGVSVNYHALNDFRSCNELLMDAVLTANVAALAAAGAISLQRVAQDGMRVRADAGAASFRRKASLERHLEEAGELVKGIKQRAATAECVNAQARNRGLQRLPVRGLGKVRAVACLYALAHNLLRMATIAPQMIGWGTGASETAATSA